MKYRTIGSDPRTRREVSVLSLGAMLFGTVPVQETVEAFAELVGDDAAGLLGASNHWAWRLEQSRAFAASAGLPAYEVLQYHQTYLRRRTDRPTLRSPDGNREPGSTVLADRRGRPGHPTRRRLFGRTAGRKSRRGRSRADSGAACEARCRVKYLTDRDLRRTGAGG